MLDINTEESRKWYHNDDIDQTTRRQLAKDEYST
jgi:hypothetical protein